MPTKGIPFAPDPHSPLYTQVMTYLEDQIDSRQLAPGCRIPSTDSLAAALGVGRKVIQQALSRLAERGILERSPGRGTFVARGIQTGRIGLIFDTNLLTTPNIDFFRLLCSEIIEEARRHHLKVSLHFPTGVADVGSCMEEVLRLAREGKLLGVINFTEDELDDCPVPSIKGRSHTGNFTSRESLAFRGATYLLSRGYRRITLLSHLFPAEDHDRNAISRQGIADALADYSTEATITLLPGSLTDPSLGGREVMDRLLSDGSCPLDALLVLDDNLTRGAIFSILAHRLRIPEDIAVLSHSNKGSPILSPVELTRLENDPAEFALHTLELLLSRLEGREPKSTSPHTRLLIGRSCGE